MFSSNNFDLVVICLCAVGLGLMNIPTTSLQRGKTPPTNVQDITLNNLIVLLQ